ncbi:helix-turn-helix transcriptional regulator, partial [Flavonifractor plautii]|uniref:helix-turn-helix transcriptional regulator n=1 Tax=Flavonifractor plautii TaxID=292800 RepID=UPI001FADEC4F
HLAAALRRHRLLLLPHLLLVQTGAQHRLRKQAGLSQEQVAVKLQVMGLPVSREIISQMELGRYSIRVSVLIALKQIYGVSYEEFFQGLPDSR